MIFWVLAALFAGASVLLTHKELKRKENPRLLMWIDAGISFFGALLFAGTSVYAEIIISGAETETAQWARDMLSLDMSVLGLYAAAVTLILEISSLLSLAEAAKGKGKYSSFIHTARVISVLIAPLLLLLGVYFFSQITYYETLPTSEIVLSFGIALAMMMRSAAALEMFVDMKSYVGKRGWQK